MDPIRNLFEIDLKAFALTMFTVLLALEVIIKLFNWFIFEWLGIETKSMREKREEHELLISTANDLKKLSNRHTEDVNQSIKHDQKIQDNLNRCIEEIQKSIGDTQESIQKFADNRIHDREQSIRIQKELVDSITKISDSNDIRDEQIKNIIASQKESLADRINQKYKYYLSINGIPEDEVDEFVSLHRAYKLCGGNHTGDAKFNYCMEHLQIIPVDVKLKYDEKE